MITNFYHEVPNVFNVMHDLMLCIFEHLGITSSLDVDDRVKYIERILKGESQKKFKSVLVSYKENNLYEEGENWTIG